MGLTIRNLTPDTIDLKLVERFEAPKGSNDGPSSPIANITSNLTSLLTRSEPSSKQLEENAQSFEKHDVSHRIEPFAINRTDVKAPEKDVLRLTLSIRDQRYRLDIPTSSKRSTTLTPLVNDPRVELTAIYLEQHAFLALFSTANLNSWMKSLKDSTPLSALSIPGTHNSPTYYRALPSVRCQAVSPKDQLENGVRFFDLRVQVETPDDPKRDGLALVHSVFPISMTGTKYLRDLVTDTQAFLKRNPSETVIFSLKREGTGTGTDAQLGRVLRDHYAGDIAHWFTAPRVPSLGEARGKIVLIRRFVLEDRLEKEWDGKGWGIDAGTWADNTPHDLCPSGDICVQDFYEVLETENIDRKIRYSKEHMARAAECVCPLDHAPEKRKPPFYVNFLSASNFWKVGCWPERIAAKLNPAMVEYLCVSHNEPGEEKRNVGDGSTGIVVCDWVGAEGDWDLVRCIVGMNAKLELRERGGR